MSTFSGEQIAQVNNPDPFAPPVWRSPVLPHPRLGDHHRPALAAASRLVGFLLRHPVADLVAAVLVGGVAVPRLARPGPSWPLPSLAVLAVAVAVARLVLPVRRPARCWASGGAGTTSGTGPR